MRLICYFLASAVLQNYAFAAFTPASETSVVNPDHEILLGATGGTAVLQDSNLTLGLTAGYNRTISEHWQLGAFPYFAFGYATGGVGTSYNVGLFVGPTFNFSDDMVNSFFLRTTVGVRHMHLSLQNFSDTSVGAQALLGKRFNIFGNVEYTPSIGFEQTFRSGAKTGLVVNFLALSATF